MNNFKFVAWFRHALIAVLLLLAGFFLDAAEPATASSKLSPLILPASDEAEKAIKTFRPATGLRVDLFAAEPLLANPVAFCFDERGRVYVVETFRRGGGMLDIEGRAGWEDPAITNALGPAVVADYLLNEELASKTVEESIALLKRHLGPRAASLSGMPERLQLIIPGADGKAERSVVFAEGFDRIGDGLASDHPGCPSLQRITCRRDRLLDPAAQSERHGRGGCTGGGKIRRTLAGIDSHGERTGRSRGRSCTPSARV